MHRQFLTVSLACLISLATSACLDKQGRIEQKLLEFGLPAATAQCMARPLASDLSVGQLKQLGALVSAVGKRNGPGGMDVLLHQLGRMDDPEIPLVVGRAALKCTFAR